MKLNKKTTVISWFVAGAMLFGTAAAADLIIGDGYNGAKSALKYTSKTLAYEANNFTFDASYSIKYDGNVIQSSKNTIKQDTANQKRDEESETFSVDKINGNSEYKNHTYYDPQKYISKFGDDDNYYQYNYGKGSENDLNFTDPFEEDMASDAEKICDAFVSSMKDFVQVADGDDGGKVYYGSLDSSQIPAFANAVSSVMFKYSFLDEYQRKSYGIADIKDNLYFTNVEGKVSQNANGILDSAVGSATIIGTDKDGTTHEFVFSLNVAVRDINSTKVSEPDIPEGKLVIESDYGDGNELTQKDVGKFTCAIVKNGKNAYEKIGDAVLIINSADGDNITGEVEITKDGNTQTYSIDNAEYKPDMNGGYWFSYTDADGEELYGTITRYYNNGTGCNLSLEMDLDDVDFENTSWSSKRSDNGYYVMTRVFE